MIYFWTTPDGEWRGLGNHPSTSGNMLATMGALPDIPSSEWKDFDLRSTAPIKVKDQNGKGACNGHAAATSLEWARHISGQPYRPLSGWMPYAILCRGRDVGSSITDALALLQSTGTCEEPLMPWGAINPSLITPSARQDASRFRIEIGYKRDDFKSLCIAAQLRQPYNFSVPVNGNFNSLDSYGRPMNHAGTHNHAVTGGMGMKRLANGEWAILMQNSWSEKWGQKGYCWISEKNLGGWGWDAYSVVATTLDSTDRTPALN